MLAHLSQFHKICLKLLLSGLVFTQIASLNSAKAEASNIDANAGADIIFPLQIIKQQDLDFGVQAPNRTKIGRVQVKNHNDKNSQCGSELVCLKGGNRAVFLISGEPYTSVLIEDPGHIYIQDTHGDQMLVDAFTASQSGGSNTWNGQLDLDENGEGQVFIGADLHVNPEQCVDNYTGTFTITAEYE